MNCSLDGHYLGSVSITYTPGKNSPQKAPASATPEKQEESKPFPVKKVLLITFIVLCLLGFVGVVLFAIRHGLFEIETGNKRQKVHTNKIFRKRSSMPKHRSGRSKKEPVRRQSFGSAQTPRLHSEFERSQNTWEDDSDNLDDLL